MFTVLVVLPTPPFWLAIVMMRVTEATQDHVRVQSMFHVKRAIPEQRLPLGHHFFGVRQVACAYCVAPRVALTTVVAGSTQGLPIRIISTLRNPYCLISGAADSISPATDWPFIASSRPP